MRALRRGYSGFGGLAGIRPRVKAFSGVLRLGNRRLGKHLLGKHLLGKTLDLDAKLLDAGPSLRGQPSTIPPAKDFPLFSCPTASLCPRSKRTSAVAAIRRTYGA